MMFSPFLFPFSYLLPPLTCINNDSTSSDAGAVQTSIPKTVNTADLSGSPPDFVAGGTQRGLKATIDDFGRVADSMMRGTAALNGTEASAPTAFEIARAKVSYVDCNAEFQNDRQLAAHHGRLQCGRNKAVVPVSATYSEGNPPPVVANNEAAVMSESNGEPRLCQITTNQTSSSWSLENHRAPCTSQDKLYFSQNQQLNSPAKNLSTSIPTSSNSVERSAMSPQPMEISMYPERESNCKSENKGCAQPVQTIIPKRRTCALFTKLICASNPEDRQSFSSVNDAQKFLGCGIQQWYDAKRKNMSITAAVDGRQWHIATETSEHGIAQDSKAPLLVCQICAKTFQSKKGLGSHKNSSICLQEVERKGRAKCKREVERLMDVHRKVCESRCGSEVKFEIGTAIHTELKTIAEEATTLPELYAGILKLAACGRENAVSVSTLIANSVIKDIIIEFENRPTTRKSKAINRGWDGKSWNGLFSNDSGGTSVFSTAVFNSCVNSLEKGTYWLIGATSGVIRINRDEERGLDRRYFWGTKDEFYRGKTSAKENVDVSQKKRKISESNVGSLVGGCGIASRPKAREVVMHAEKRIKQSCTDGSGPALKQERRGFGLLKKASSTTNEKQESKHKVLPIRNMQKPTSGVKSPQQLTHTASSLELKRACDDRVEESLAACVLKAQALEAATCSKRVPPIRKDLISTCAWLVMNNGEGDSNVVSLNLGGQFICTNGFKLLASSLKHNIHLRELFIYNTDIKLEGMQALVAGLDSNLSLSCLNLGENTMCAETMKCLLGLLKRSPAIKNLYLDWGVTNGDVKKEIRRLLAPEAREKLWIKLYGAVPEHARQKFGHHSGKFHLEGKRDKREVKEEGAQAKHKPLPTSLPCTSLPMENSLSKCPRVPSGMPPRIEDVCIRCYARIFAAKDDSGDFRAPHPAKECFVRFAAGIIPLKASHEGVRCPSLPEIDQVKQASIFRTIRRRYEQWSSGCTDVPPKVVGDHSRDNWGGFAKEEVGSMDPRIFWKLERKTNAGLEASKSYTANGRLRHDISAMCRHCDKEYPSYAQRSRMLKHAAQNHPVDFQRALDQQKRALHTHRVALSSELNETQQQLLLFFDENIKKNRATCRVCRKTVTSVNDLQMITHLRRHSPIELSDFAGVTFSTNDFKLEKDSRLSKVNAARDNDKPRKRAKVFIENKQLEEVVSHDKTLRLSMCGSDSDISAPDTQCPSCGISFPTPKEMETHMRRCLLSIASHGIPAEPIMLNQAVTTHPEQQCNKCKKFFRSGKSFTTHRNWCFKATGVKCPVCNRTMRETDFIRDSHIRKCFGNLGNLVVFKTTGATKFQCRQCPKLYPMGKDVIAKQIWHMACYHLETLRALLRGDEHYICNQTHLPHTSDQKSSSSVIEITSRSEIESPATEAVEAAQQNSDSSNEAALRFIKDVEDRLGAESESYCQFVTLLTMSGAGGSEKVRSNRRFLEGLLEGYDDLIQGMGIFFAPQTQPTDSVHESLWPSPCAPIHSKPVSTQPLYSRVLMTESTESHGIQSETLGHLDGTYLHLTERAEETPNGVNSYGQLGYQLPLATQDLEINSNESNYHGNSDGFLF